MKHIYWKFAIIVICTLASAQVSAVGCGALGTGGPNPFNIAGNSYWYVSFSAAQQPVAATMFMGNGIIATGLNCNAFPVVNDFCCNAVVSSYASIVWRSASPSQMVASNICTFMTAMGSTCDMRGSDGLPVELMEFSVE